MILKIRYAIKSDLGFIDYLQKKNAEDLSFYPKAVLERETDNERILLALVNNQHAGYLYHGAIRLDKPLKIHQACIEYDLRGNWYGAGLCNRLEEIGAIGGVKTISLRCGSDIAANTFWKNMGYSCVSIQKGGVRRMRDINVWNKQIGADLFGFDAIKPSNKKKSAKVWSKRNKSITQNSMLRGKALLDYRNLLENEEKD